MPLREAAWDNQIWGVDEYREGAYGRVHFYHSADGHAAGLQGVSEGAHRNPHRFFHVRLLPFRKDGFGTDRRHVLPYLLEAPQDGPVDRYPPLSGPPLPPLQTLRPWQQASGCAPSTSRCTSCPWPCCPAGPVRLRTGGWAVGGLCLPLFLPPLVPPALLRWQAGVEVIGRRRGGRLSGRPA